MDEPPDTSAQPSEPPIPTTGDKSGRRLRFEYESVNKERSESSLPTMIDRLGKWVFSLFEGALKWGIRLTLALAILWGLRVAISIIYDQATRGQRERDQLAQEQRHAAYLKPKEWPDHTTSKGITAKLTTRYHDTTEQLDYVCELAGPAQTMESVINAFSDDLSNHLYGNTLAIKLYDTDGFVLLDLDDLSWEAQAGKSNLVLRAEGTKSFYQYDSVASWKIIPRINL